MANHLIKMYFVILYLQTSFCIDIFNKKIKHNGSCTTLTKPHYNRLRKEDLMINSQFRVKILLVEEIFRLIGSSKKEIITDSYSYFQLAKRAANGWDVMVVQMLFQKLFNESKKKS